MKELIKNQIIEARMWINDCHWCDEPGDLENLTEDELIRGIDRHYDGGWIQFTKNC